MGGDLEIVECLAITGWRAVGSGRYMLSRRKVTLLLISLGSVYLAICLALYFLQDRLLFPGTNRPQAAQLALPAGVRVLELELSDGTRYRTAVFDAEKPRGVLAYFVGNGEDLESGVRWAANFGAYGLQTIVTE